MLPVTSAIQSDILHLFLRAVDVYILEMLNQLIMLVNVHIT